MNLKADVKQTISNGVHQILAEKPSASTIVLDQVEAGFGAVAFVIAMQQHKCVVAVLSYPLADRT